MEEGTTLQLYNSSSDNALSDNDDWHSTGSGVIKEKDTLVDKAKCRQYLKHDGVIRGLHNYINDSFKEWEQTDLHVGIFGASGVGKSSLINALRNVKDTDERAAKVDVVEVVCKPTPYQFPQHSHVLLWDMPGIGTETYRQNTSTLEKLELSKFEVVLIVTCTRLNEIDLWLADESLKAGCYVLFVRSKIDNDVYSSGKRGIDETTCLNTIRDKTNDKLKKHTFPCKKENANTSFFMVSSDERDSYDLRSLTLKLQEMLSGRATRLTSQLEPLALEMIEQERKSNIEKYTGRKIFAAVYGFLPLPVLETKFGALSVEEIMKESKREFRLDDESLIGLSSVIKESIKNKEEDVESAIKENDGKLLREKTEDSKWSWFRKYSKYVLPVVGSFLSASKEVDTTEACIEEVSNVLAAKLKELVQIRLKNLQQDLTPIKLS